MALTHAQQVGLALGPKFSGSLSILGSSWIIFEVLRDKKKQAMVYHRLLLGMSILDVMISFAWFLSTWPVPAETEGLWGNVGNQATCNAQGFFIQLKIANPFYNTFLALYYVLVVRYGWTERRVKSLEPMFHLTPVLMALGTSTASLFLDQFNSATLWCWLAPFPATCEGSHRGETCERGDNAWIYRLAFFYTWYWASLVFVTAAMLVVYWTVRSHEVASQEFSASGKKNTRKVATQAMLYIGAYYLTALFATVTRVMQAFAPATPYWAKLCMTIFYPMQGFFNFFIYVRPRYIRYRRRHPEWSLMETAKQCIRRAFASSSEDDDFKLGTGSEDERSTNTTATGSRSFVSEIDSNDFSAILSPDDVADLTKQSDCNNKGTDTGDESNQKNES